MADILVRNIDADVARRMKERARAKGTSVNEIAREALREFFKPSRDEIWAEIDRLRARIGPLSGDSTAMIREDRDNDEPYR
jgi:plasmid stability protein